MLFRSSAPEGHTEKKALINLKKLSWLAKSVEDMKTECINFLKNRIKIIKGKPFQVNDLQKQIDASRKERRTSSRSRSTNPVVLEKTDKIDRFATNRLMGITYQHTQMLALNKVLHDYVDKNNFDNMLPTFDEILGENGQGISLDSEGNVITKNRSIIKSLKANAPPPSGVDDGKELMMNFIDGANKEYIKNNNIDYQNKLLQDAGQIITFLENKGIMRGNAKDKIQGIEQIINKMIQTGEGYDDYDKTKWVSILDRIRALRQRVLENAAAVLRDLEEHPKSRTTEEVRAQTGKMETLIDAVGLDFHGEDVDAARTVAKHKSSSDRDFRGPQSLPAHQRGLTAGPSDRAPMW